MGVLKRIVKAVINEATKPESFAKGEEFEAYLRKYIFPSDLYHLEHQSHDYNSNKNDYVEDSLDPDFIFVSKQGEKMFHVEAKYRSDFYDNAVEWCKPYQMKRYKAANVDIPVFIALGVGNRPSQPDFLFVFPVKKVKYAKLFMSVLEKYEFQPDTPISQPTLWKLLK